MMISFKQPLSLPCSFGPHFRVFAVVCSLPRSLTSGKPLVAARPLPHTIYSPSEYDSSRAQLQSRDLILLHQLGLQRLPLYNPHRTR